MTDKNEFTKLSGDNNEAETTVTIAFIYKGQLLKDNIIGSYLCNNEEEQEMVNYYFDMLSYQNQETTFHLSVIEIPIGEIENGKMEEQ